MGLLDGTEPLLILLAPHTIWPKVNGQLTITPTVYERVGRNILKPYVMFVPKRTRGCRHRRCRFSPVIFSKYQKQKGLRTVRGRQRSNPGSQSEHSQTNSVGHTQKYTVCRTGKVRIRVKQNKKHKKHTKILEALIWSWTPVCVDDSCHSSRKAFLKVLESVCGFLCPFRRALRSRTDVRREGLFAGAFKDVQCG